MYNVQTGVISLCEETEVLMEIFVCNGSDSLHTTRSSTLLSLRALWNCLTVLYGCWSQQAKAQPTQKKFKALFKHLSGWLICTMGDTTNFILCDCSLFVQSNTLIWEQICVSDTHCGLSIFKVWSEHNKKIWLDSDIHHDYWKEQRRNRQTYTERNDAAEWPKTMSWKNIINRTVPEYPELRHVGEMNTYTIL